MTGSNDDTPSLSVEMSASEKKLLESEDGKTTINPTSKNSPLMAWLLIALFSIGAAIYAIYATIQLRQETRQGTNTLITRMNWLKEQQIETKALLENQITAKKDSDNHFKNELTLLEQQLHTSLLQNQYQSKDWILLKTRYYLELADINLHWSNNVDTTIALLEQANLSLATVHEHPVFSIRQVIAKEIEQLQSMPKLDIVRLLSQLDAIDNLIQQLPLKQATSLKTKTIITNTPTSPSSWTAHFKQSIDLLQTLIVVRHNDETIAPIPSPIYEALLRERIRLNIQQAEWAILQSNQALYQRALDLVILALNQSFKPTTEAKNTILQQLKTLQQIQLTAQKPILDESLRLLNQLIDSKNHETHSAKGETPS